VSELDDWVAKACRDAATRIVTGDRSAPPASTRENLELFYALTALLPDPPPTEATPEPAAPRRAGAVPAPRALVPPRARARPRARAAPGAEETPPGRGRPAATVRHGGVRIPTPALVALLVALAFVTVLLLLPRPTRHAEPEFALYLVGTGAARSARGVALIGAGELTIFASGLSELEAGYRYVAWSTTDEGYERIGTLTVLGPGRARLRGRTDEDPSLIEVSIEPSSATGRPTGPMVLAGFAEDR